MWSFHKSEKLRVFKKLKSFHSNVCEYMLKSRGSHRHVLRDLNPNRYSNSFTEVNLTININSKCALQWEMEPLVRWLYYDDSPMVSLLALIGKILEDLSNSMKHGPTSYDHTCSQARFLRFLSSTKKTFPLH